MGQNIYFILGVMFMKTLTPICHEWLKTQKQKVLSEVKALSTTIQALVCQKEVFSKVIVLLAVKV